LNDAICASLIEKPYICSYYGFNNTLDFPTSQGVGFWIILSLGISLSFVLLGWFLCRRFLNRRLKDSIEADTISDRINSVVSSYVALKDQRK
jgi:hypothetical protein